VPRYDGALTKVESASRLSLNRTPAGRREYPNCSSILFLQRYRAAAEVQEPVPRYNCRGVSHSCDIRGRFDVRHVVVIATQ
jgi:hypothetical protein